MYYTSNHPLPTFSTVVELQIVVIMAKGWEGAAVFMVEIGGPLLMFLVGWLSDPRATETSIQ